MIDTHCHLNFDQYAADREQIIQRAAEAGVTRIINPGVDVESSKAGIALSKQYPGLYAAVGVHPNSTADFADADLHSVRALAAENKVVAIGEIGLDYYWDKSPKEKQRSAFEAQLALAGELNLPVIIHNREASEDVISILEAWVKSLPSTLKERPGVLHSFSAPPAVAEHALRIGFYLGFTGPITFKKAEETRVVARSTPQDRILVETDGPFLTPIPHRGKRNEPAYIPFIVDRLASLKQLTTEQMADITTDNAVRLFHFK
jgi:TatD DNase family protein